MIPRYKELAMDLTREPYGDNVIPSTSRGWVAVRMRDGVAHVVPVNDGMYHLPEDCGCHPRVDLTTRADDTLGVVYVHHSLDNREATETQ
jgi:hypothetical protein